jgi:8-oxo-dGTP pyrophosphatase MutT (NUDIX family)
MDDIPRPSATVVLLRDGPDGLEVLMVRRHEKSAFMGGAYVFPGGAVDASDRELAGPRWTDGIAHAERQIPQLDPPDAVAHHVAAIRELFEEAGILLARDSVGQLVSFGDPAVAGRLADHRRKVHAGSMTFQDVLAVEGLRAAADALVLYAHWVTPPLGGRRFDTRFFAARLPPDQTAAHDERETTGSAWTSAGEAIQAAERREILLPPPTWITLRELAEFGGVDDVLAWTSRRDVIRREAGRGERDGSRVLLLPHPDFATRWGRSETPFVWTDDRWLPLSPSDV